MYDAKCDVQNNIKRDVNTHGYRVTNSF